jgi:hypothetical protein
MFLFIDESGDPGFVGSATKYFVVCAVMFSCMDDLQDTQHKIEDFKKRERLHSEIHFVKIANNIKDKFFYLIKGCRFSAKAICVNKEEIYKDNSFGSRNKLYDFMLKMLLDSLDTKEEMNIVLDGKMRKELQTQLRNYLKLNTELNVKKIRHIESEKDVLIQLADMVASCIGRSYNKKEKENSDKWKNIIAEKINIWNYK